MHRGPMAKNPGESAWERPSRSGNRAANKRIKADHTQGIRPAGKLNGCLTGCMQVQNPRERMGPIVPWTSRAIHVPKGNRSRNKPSQEGNRPRKAALDLGQGQRRSRDGTHVAKPCQEETGEPPRPRTMGDPKDSQQQADRRMKDLPESVRTG